MNKIKITKTSCLLATRQIVRKQLNHSCTNWFYLFNKTNWMHLLQRLIDITNTLRILHKQTQTNENVVLNPNFVVGLNKRYIQTHSLIDITPHTMPFMKWSLNQIFNVLVKTNKNNSSTKLKHTIFKPEICLYFESFNKLKRKQLIYTVINKVWKFGLRKRVRVFLKRQNLVRYQFNLKKKNLKLGMSALCKLQQHLLRQNLLYAYKRLKTYTHTNFFRFTKWKKNVSQIRHLKLNEKQNKIKKVTNWTHNPPQQHQIQTKRYYQTDNNWNTSQINYFGWLGFIKKKSRFMYKVSCSWATMHTKKNYMAKRKPVHHKLRLSSFLFNLLQTLHYHRKLKKLPLNSENGHKHIYNLLKRGQFMKILQKNKITQNGFRWIMSHNLSIFRRLNLTWHTLKKKLKFFRKKHFNMKKWKKWGYGVSKPASWQKGNLKIFTTIYKKIQKQNQNWHSLWSYKTFFLLPNVNKKQFEFLKIYFPNRKHTLTDTFFFFSFATKWIEYNRYFPKFYFKKWPNLKWNISKIKPKYNLIRIVNKTKKLQLKYKKYWKYRVKPRSQLPYLLSKTRYNVRSFQLPYWNFYCVWRRRFWKKKIKKPVFSLLKKPFFGIENFWIFNRKSTNVFYILQLKHNFKKNILFRGLKKLTWLFLFFKRKPLHLKDIHFYKIINPQWRFFTKLPNEYVSSNLIVRQYLKLFLLKTLTYNPLGYTYPIKNRSFFVPNTYHPSTKKWIIWKKNYITNNKNFGKLKRNLVVRKNNSYQLFLHHINELSVVNLRGSTAQFVVKTQICKFVKHEIREKNKFIFSKPLKQNLKIQWKTVNRTKIKKKNVNYNSIKKLRSTTRGELEKLFYKHTQMFGCIREVSWNTILHAASKIINLIKLADSRFCLKKKKYKKWAKGVIKNSNTKLKKKIKKNHLVNKKKNLQTVKIKNIRKVSKNYSRHKTQFKKTVRVKKCVKNLKISWRLFTVKQQHLSFYLKKNVTNFFILKNKHNNYFILLYWIMHKTLRLKHLYKCRVLQWLRLNRPNFKRHKFISYVEFMAIWHKLLRNRVAADQVIKFQTEICPGSNEMYKFAGTNLLWKQRYFGGKIKLNSKKKWYNTTLLHKFKKYKTKNGYNILNSYCNAKRSVFQQKRFYKKYGAVNIFGKFVNAILTPKQQNFRYFKYLFPYIKKLKWLRYSKRKKKHSCVAIKIKTKKISKWKQIKQLKHVYGKTNKSEILLQIQSLGRYKKLKEISGPHKTRFCRLNPNKTRILARNVVKLSQRSKILPRRKTLFFGLKKKNKKKIYRRYLNVLRGNRSWKVRKKKFKYQAKIYRYKPIFSYQLRKPWNYQRIGLFFKLWPLVYTNKRSLRTNKWMVKELFYLLKEWKHSHKPNPLKRKDTIFFEPWMCFVTFSKFLYIKQTKRPFLSKFRVYKRKSNKSIGLVYHNMEPKLPEVKTKLDFFTTEKNVPHKISVFLKRLLVKSIYQKKLKKKATYFYQRFKNYIHIHDLRKHRFKLVFSTVEYRVDNIVYRANWGKTYQWSQALLYSEFVFVI